MTSADTYAEMAIVGCCAASEHGARLAHDRLTVDHFTVPAFAAVFRATADLPDMPRPTDEDASTWARARLADEDPPSIWPGELRLVELARRLRCPLQDLEQLVAQRPVADDISGTYALRLIAALHERRIQADVVELHELLRRPAAGDHRRAGELASTIAQRLGEAS